METTNQMAATPQMGTPQYQSPEIIRNEPYSFKSDIWALGCVLYELCTLRKPFDANDPQSLRVKVLNQEPEPISGDYSDQLKGMVKLLLTKEQEATMMGKIMMNILDGTYQRPSILEILKSDLMAPYLRAQGYEPRLMGLVTEKLKHVIDHQTQKLNGLEDPSKRTEIELCLARLVNS